MFIARNIEDQLCKSGKLDLRSGLPLLADKMGLTWDSINIQTELS